jgi:hypothetical protein
MEAAARVLAAKRTFFQGVLTTDLRLAAYARLVLMIEEEGLFPRKVSQKSTHSS